MELQRKETKEMLDDLTTRDQRMMFGILTMVHLADSKKQLDSDTDVYKRQALDQHTGTYSRQKVSAQAYCAAYVIAKRYGVDVTGFNLEMCIRDRLFPASMVQKRT